MYNVVFYTTKDGFSEIQEYLQKLQIKRDKDSRIKLIHNDINLGLAKSLNKGIDLIKTDYFIRMDTDDIAKKNRIEKQMKFVEEHPQYSIVAGNANYFNENGIYNI